jgi:hypothetical protein
VLTYAAEGQRSAESPEAFTLGLVRRIVYFVHRAGADAEVSYGYLCGMNRIIDGRSAGQDVVLVLTSRTMAWVAGESTYYPNLRALSDEYIATHIEPYYRVLANIDRKVFILRPIDKHMTGFEEASIWSGPALVKAAPVQHAATPVATSREGRCRTLGFPVVSRQEPLYLAQ